MANNYDLGMLRVFVSVYKTRSVTLAAENLFVAQPTVSYALGKLRKRFGDELWPDVERRQAGQGRAALRPGQKAKGLRGEHLLEAAMSFGRRAVPVLAPHPRSFPRKGGSGRWWRFNKRGRGGRWRFNRRQQGQVFGEQEGPHLAGLLSGHANRDQSRAASSASAAASFTAPAASAAASRVASAAWSAACSASAAA